VQSTGRLLLKTQHHISALIGYRKKGRQNVAAEKQFEEKVKKFLKDNGCWLLKYWGGGGFTKSGIPDLLVCCNTHFIAVELKAPNGKPSDLQLVTLRQISKAGGICVLLYPKDFDQFKHLIMLIKADATPLRILSEHPITTDWMELYNKIESEEN
jgi:Holliday junction resolvase